MTIGDDVSLIGFDDVSMVSQVDRPLTTVRNPVEQIAMEAIELLVDLIEERQVTRIQRELSTELIVRQTTARPKPRS